MKTTVMVTGIDGRDYRIEVDHPPEVERPQYAPLVDGRDHAGEAYSWCQRCRRTPNVRLMGWTPDGHYWCRDCRS